MRARVSNRACHCVLRGEIECSPLALVWQLAKLVDCGGTAFPSPQDLPNAVGSGLIGQTQFFAVGSEGRSREWGGGQPTPSAHVPCRLYLVLNRPTCHAGFSRHRQRHCKNRACGPSFHPSRPSNPTFQAEFQTKSRPTNQVGLRRRPSKPLAQAVSRYMLKSR